MPVTVVRYQTSPERADENQGLIEAVFAELADRRPEGLRYASFRLADGVSFVHVAAVDTADGHNPLTDSPAFQAFTADIGSRCVDPPLALAGTVVGSYGFPLAAASAGAGGAVA
jgi:hypothetical protein